MNRLKRVSWITWRIYWFALPINISVLAFSVDHELTSIKIIGTWGLVAALSHFALIPLYISELDFQMSMKIGNLTHFI